jgi:hypothetical protein
MKYLSVILAAILLSTPATGALTVSRDYATELLGNWICKDFWPGYSAFEMIRYKKDGTWNSFGEVIVDFPIEENYLKVRYGAVGTGLWEIENDKLVSLIDYVKVTTRTHSWIDEYFNMQDQFTLNEKTSEEIVVLSDNYINLKPNTGKGYECYKVYL